MSRDIPPLLLPLLENDVLFPFYTVTLEFDSETLNFWTGSGQLILDDVTYIGTHDLMSISDIEETSELAVKGATLSLAGLDSSVVSLALQEPYQGRPCTINFGLYTNLAGQGKLLNETSPPKAFILLEQGGDIQLEGDIAFTEIFSGYMDTMDITEGTQSSTIAIAASNKLIDLERSRVFKYNKSTQESVDAKDKGFNWVEAMADKSVYWGTDGPD